ncbi:MAG: phosphatidylserine decarboxylase, partial [Candidatus Melainabacteria bacterium HGW-Melainabacteria-1]
MDFYYGHPLGRLIERGLISQPMVSALYGWLRRRPSSAAAQIKAFVETYGLDTRELALELKDFKSFQDFFVRELKAGARPLPDDSESLISAADARLLAYPLHAERLLPVKGRSYSLFELLRNRSLARQFEHGLALIYRLAPVDYHRFCYIDTGWHGPHVRLGHKLHSVHPL